MKHLGIAEFDLSGRIVKVHTNVDIEDLCRLRGWRVVWGSNGTYGTFSDINTRGFKPMARFHMATIEEH